ncbi:tyrosine-protein phosphatase [bacterium]|nr:tyrosine-protein phosphatase [bacterium]
MNKSWLISLGLVVCVGLGCSEQQGSPFQDSPKQNNKVVASELKAKKTNQERQITLHGTRNTRDLGGLPASSGMYVKEGVIYRSGTLCYIDNDDAEVLKGKKIKSVIDLRTSGEIEREGRDIAAFTDSLDKVYNCPLLCTAGCYEWAYVSYIKKHNHESIAKFFHILADQNNYPVLFHCSAGKDRTGILAALLLELLGTPRSIIMDDYLQSQRNSEGLKVDKEWLQTVFMFVDKEGGVEQFLKNRGVSSEDMRKIKEQLLTK